MGTRAIVAIDGPAGAGKSTLARELAARLHYTYIDTGAMYRAVALRARQLGVDWDDEAAIVQLAGRLSFRFDGARLRVDEEDVSALIRSPEMSEGASRVSRWRGVREALVAAQRRMGEAGGVVMEGRDIGTVVFPSAEVKIFLTASVEERARRRAAELMARGEPVEVSEVLADVERRDRRDSERAHAPLRRAKDARLLETDGRSVHELLDVLERWVRERERQ